MRATLLLLTACVAVPLLPAQNNSQVPRDWRKKQVREQVEQMRKAMREGRIVRYNVQVKVRLKNGNRIKGIVRNGRFIEKSDGLDFVVTEKRSANAGMRLWYYNGTNSYVFLPYAQIAHYKLGTRLSDKEIRDLERKLVAADRRRREIERQLAEKNRRGKLGGSGQPAKKEPDDVEKYGRALIPKERELLKWLEDYPPDKGWGQKKLRDLQVRRITLGVYPNKEEKRFEDNFDKWSEALELMEELERSAKAGGPPTGGSSSGGSSTGGNSTGGNSTGGSSTGGNSTGGNSTGGNIPGSSTGGNIPGGGPPRR
ncbi:MAG: hypothetical protein ACYTGW_15660 [Planctomycetota bacterium]|jgi:hypothetical protein